MAALTEFELIETLLRPLASDAPGAFALTDDAAVLPDLNVGEAYVVTKDALSIGTHMLPSDPPGDMARKALRVNLSDLAAMGARPVGFFMALCLGQDTDEGFLRAFVAALDEDVALFDVPLMGGDIIRHAGAFTVTITAFGAVQRDQVMRRNGARAGDSLWVSGTIGDGALGLLAAKGDLPKLEEGHRLDLIQRYRVPHPRLALGAALRGVASACIDISDGLLADAGHMCGTSAVGCTIQTSAIPLSDAGRAALVAEPDLFEKVLTGGDDYELAFAVAREDETQLVSLAAQAQVPVKRIGTFESETGIRVLDEKGQAIQVTREGYRHE